MGCVIAFFPPFSAPATAQEVFWVLERPDRGWSVRPTETVEICRHSTWTWLPAS